MRFFLFGQAAALRCLARGEVERFKTCFLAPVLLFRYAEFEFVHASAAWEGVSVLDISSPHLFSAFLCKKSREVTVSMYNPDVSDMSRTKAFFSSIGVPREKVIFLPSLPQEESRFDVVVSISVLEHVVQEDVYEFLRSVWNCMRPDGVFIVTVPVAKEHREEYRDFNSYGLRVPRANDGSYFYQRVYDDETLEEHIVAPWKKLGGAVVHREIHGLKQGFAFGEYTRRRRHEGRAVTRDDIFRYKCYLTRYASAKHMPDRGVCGLVLSKGSNGTSHGSVHVR